MLNNFFIKLKFINFFKNNFFYDYFIKIIVKKNIYNLFIYLGFFFAEKFLIEYNTKYIFIYLTYTFLNFFKKLNFNTMYINIFVILLNIILLII